MRRASLVLALACASCTQSHPIQDPLPLADFCGAFFDAVCGPLEACGCGDAAAAECRGRERDLCAGFPTPALENAIAQDRLRYDGHAAAVLVTRLAARGCTDVVPTLGWRVRDLFSLDGIFEGTRQAGEPCEVIAFELISECSRGSCAPVGAGHACRAAVGLGDACDDLHQCADLDARLTSQLGVERLTLRCVSSVCAPRAATGETCSSNFDCSSGRCRSSTCEPPGQTGDACDASLECASSACGLEGLCLSGQAAAGEACSADAECASYACATRCLPAGCGTF